ncbi:MAG: hypothetical protein NVSMB57_13790 [Actinomycetota bacterium]
MAVRLGVYYKQMSDPDTFEKRYLEEHLPLVKAYDHIKSTSFFKVSRKIAGDFPYAFAFVGIWDDKDGFKADMNSGKAMEATEHAKTLGAEFDVVMLDDLDIWGM